MTTPTQNAQRIIDGDGLPDSTVYELAHAYLQLLTVEQSHRELVHQLRTDLAHAQGEDPTKSGCVAYVSTGGYHRCGARPAGPMMLKLPWLPEGDSVRIWLCTRHMSMWDEWVRAPLPSPQPGMTSRRAH